MTGQAGLRNDLGLGARVLWLGVQQPDARQLRREVVAHERAQRAQHDAQNTQHRNDKITYDLCDRNHWLVLRS